MANNRLKYTEYIELVDAIFGFYITENGVYDPVNGDMGTMYAYYITTYNKEDKQMPMKEFLDNLTDDFINAYNREIKTTRMDFTFGSAYRAAMSKVKHAVNPINNLSNIVYGGLNLLLSGVNRDLPDLAKESSVEADNTIEGMEPVNSKLN